MRLAVPVSATWALGWAEITTLMDSEPALLFLIHTINVHTSLSGGVKANQCGECVFCLAKKKLLLYRNRYVIKGLSIGFVNAHVGL